MKEMKGDRTEILDGFIGLSVWAMFVRMCLIQDSGMHTKNIFMGDWVTTNHSLVYSMQDCQK